MSLEGIYVDDKLQFVEEPIEIMEREDKRLKRSRIPLVKVRWNSRRGPEFTWEREDSFKKKYPQLFINWTSSTTTRSDGGDSLLFEGVTSNLLRKLLLSPDEGNSNFDADKNYGPEWMHNHLKIDASVQRTQSRG
ncbi:hypothetical protein Tco_1569852 [Tanacetum coccineum]